MELQLAQLSEHVWLLPHNPDPNAIQSSIGVIAIQNQSLLIDAGNSPHLARKVKTEMLRCKLPHVTRIIYTHHHWDHIYGACEFNVPVTAHRLCKDFLEAESKEPWGIEYLNEEIRRNPKLAESYGARANVSMGRGQRIRELRLPLDSKGRREFFIPGKTN